MSAFKDWKAADRPRSWDNPVRIAYKDSKRLFRRALRCHLKACKSLSSRTLIFPIRTDLNSSDKLRSFIAILSRIQPVSHTKILHIKVPTSLLFSSCMHNFLYFYALSYCSGDSCKQIQRFLFHRNSDQHITVSDYILFTAKVKPDAVD